MKKDFIGAVLASFILILLGDGVVANVGLAPRLAGGGYSWVTIVFGWACAVLVAGYVAGGENNPALQLAFALRGTNPWPKAVTLMAGAFVGCFLGALGVFLCYRDGLVAAGMPNVWSTGPGSTFGNAFWGAAGADAKSLGAYSLATSCATEFIGTMVLMWTCLCTSDERNKGMGLAGTAVVSVVVLGIGLSLGGPSGYAINPARDLAPRVFGALAGTKGLFDDLYWLWAPTLATTAGAVAGSYTWDALLASRVELPVRAARRETA